MPGNRSEEIEAPAAETTKPAPPHPQISSKQLQSNAVRQLLSFSIVSSTQLLANKHDLISFCQRCASHKIRPPRLVNDFTDTKFDRLVSSTVCPANKFDLKSFRQRCASHSIRPPRFVNDLPRKRIRPDIV